VAPSPILIASRSVGKIRELRALFSGHGIAVMGLNDLGLVETDDEAALEDATTFEENALSKARHFHARSGMATVADDSGIEVDALGGAPGVRSKRWSGRTDLSGQALDDANNALLLERLRGVSNRAARYVCVAAFRDDGREFAERGEAAGTITLDPRGLEGFGYDPYFSSTELGCTFAEISMREKARVSHRARAFRKLISRLG
jgi:XTP/dITP diphosphohydrolase